MSSQKTIWVNLNPEKVDLRPLIGRCEQKGYTCITEDVGTDQSRSIELARSADAIVSIAELWDDHALEAIRDQHKIIVRYGAGLDNVNIPAATRNGVPVANLPGMNSPAVAEIALLHILNLGRRFAYSIQGVRDGIWPCSIPGNELDGKTVGLLGFGNIARQLARMLQGFSVRILAYDAFLNEKTRDFAQKYSVELVKRPEDLYIQSDILSLHVPLVEANRGMIDKNVFGLMKPSAYLINTCRGGVVAEEDLIEALRSGKIRGAGLDVMCSEPPDKNNPLLHMENVFVTSHLGSLAVEAEERSQLLIADIAEAFFAGEVHPNVVNPEVFR